MTQDGIWTGLSTLGFKALDRKTAYNYPLIEESTETSNKEGRNGDRAERIETTTPKKEMKMSHTKRMARTKKVPRKMRTTNSSIYD